MFSKYVDRLFRVFTVVDGKGEAEEKTKLKLSKLLENILAFITQVASRKVDSFINYEIVRSKF